jgi:hypothetical protein
MRDVSSTDIGCLFLAAIAPEANPGLRSETWATQAEVASGSVRGKVLGIPHLPNAGRYGAPIICSRREKGGVRYSAPHALKSGERLVRQLELGASAVPKGRLKVAQDARASVRKASVLGSFQLSLRDSVRKWSPHADSFEALVDSSEAVYARNGADER